MDMGLWIDVSSNPQVLFKALVDPTRRAVFELLCGEGEQTVGALTARVDVSQPAVSRHLGMLKLAGLVHPRHDGRRTFYSAKPKGLTALVDWTVHMNGFRRKQTNC